MYISWLCKPFPSHGVPRYCTAGSDAVDVSRAALHALLKLAGRVGSSVRIIGLGCWGVMCGIRSHSLNDYGEFTSMVDISVYLVAFRLIHDDDHGD